MTDEHEKLKPYDVLVDRTAVKSKTVRVYAYDEHDASAKAENLATDIDFTTSTGDHGVEYEAVNVEEVVDVT